MRCGLRPNASAAWRCDLNANPNHNRYAIFASEIEASAKAPKRLSGLSIDQKDLPQLAQQAAEQWTRKFNPRPVGEKEILDLYESAF